MSNSSEDIAFYSYLSLHFSWYQARYPDVPTDELNTNYIQYDFQNLLTAQQRAEYAARVDQPAPADPSSILPPAAVVRARDQLNNRAIISPNASRDETERQGYGPTIFGDVNIGSRRRTSRSLRQRDERGRFVSESSSSRTPIGRGTEHHASTLSHRSQLARSNRSRFGGSSYQRRGKATSGIPSRRAPPRRRTIPGIMGLPQETRDRISDLTTEVIGEDFIGELNHLENAESMEAHLRTFHRNPLLHVPGLGKSITEIHNRPNTMVQRTHGLARPTIYIRVEEDALSWYNYVQHREQDATPWHNHVQRRARRDRENLQNLVNQWNRSYRMRNNSSAESIHYTTPASQRREEAWNLVERGQSAPTTWRGWLYPGIQVPGGRVPHRIGSFPVAAERNIMTAAIRDPQDQANMPPSVRPFPSLHQMQELRIVVEVRGYSDGDRIVDTVYEILTNMEQLRPEALRSRLRSLQVAFVIRGQTDDHILDGWTEIYEMQDALRDALENVRRDEFDNDDEEGAEGERALGGGPLDQLRRVTLHIHVNGRNLWSEFATTEMPDQWELVNEGGSVVQDRLDAYQDRAVRRERRDPTLRDMGYRDHLDIWWYRHRRIMRERAEHIDDLEEELEMNEDEDVDMDLDDEDADDEDHDAFARSAYQ
jgi:hypothetical protein